jgi:integrase
VVNQVAALRFFFVKTLKRHQFRDLLPYPQDRRRLPTVLSREEVSRLINAAGNLFRRTLLMTLYGTGMRRAELAHLKVSDIDSQRMIIRVVAGKGGKDRDLPLSPALLESLREYWRWRIRVRNAGTLSSWTDSGPVEANSTVHPICRKEPDRDGRNRARNSRN